MFNARGKLRVHYSLPQPQKVFEVFHLPPGVRATSMASISRARGAARQQLRAAPGHSWNCLSNVGWEKGTAVPLLPIPSLYPPAGAGQEGPAEPF